MRNAAHEQLAWSAIARRGMVHKSAIPKPRQPWSRHPHNSNIKITPWHRELAPQEDMISRTRARDGAATDSRQQAVLANESPQFRDGNHTVASRISPQEEVISESLAREPAIFNGINSSFGLLLSHGAFCTRDGIPGHIFTRQA